MGGRRFQYSTVHVCKTFLTSNHAHFSGTKKHLCITLSQSANHWYRSIDSNEQTKTKNI